MNTLKQSAKNFYSLLYEILVLIISTIKQLVLPNGRRKGNILNSAFVFFIGLVEIIIRFDYGIFRMSKLFRQKNIRQFVIIISTFLFLLSSLEWTRVEAAGNSEAYNKTVLVTQSTGKKIAGNTRISSADQVEKVCGFIKARPVSKTLPNTFVYSTTVRKYLLNRSILI